jgi:CRP-like cAMP-binding protein
VLSSQILSQIDLFEGVPEAQLTTIAEISKEGTCPRGEMIFREGTKAEQLYILLAGKVAIQVHLTSRPKTITTAIINQPHQCFGWSGIIAPHHYTASALCRTNCRFLAIHGQKLIQALEQDPKSGFVVMRRIAGVISSRLRNSRVVLLKSL